MIWRGEGSSKDKNKINMSLHTFLRERKERVKKKDGKERIRRK